MNCASHTETIFTVGHLAATVRFSFHHRLSDGSGSAAIIKELTIQGPGWNNSVAVALAEAGRTGKACEG